VISCGTGIVFDSSVSERNVTTLASGGLVETFDFSEPQMISGKWKEREKCKELLILFIFYTAYVSYDLVGEFN